MTLTWTKTDKVSLFRHCDMLTCQLNKALFLIIPQKRLIYMFEGPLDRKIIYSKAFKQS